MIFMSWNCYPWWIENSPILIWLKKIHSFWDDCPFLPDSNNLSNFAAERRCDGLAVFVKEENKRLGGPFEVDIFNNMTLEECQTMCVRAEKYVINCIMNHKKNCLTKIFISFYVEWHTSKCTN